MNHDSCMTTDRHIARNRRNETEPSNAAMRAPSSHPGTRAMASEFPARSAPAAVSAGNNTGRGTALAPRVRSVFGGPSRFQ